MACPQIHGKYSLRIQACLALILSHAMNKLEMIVCKLMFVYDLVTLLVTQLINY